MQRDSTVDGEVISRVFMSDDWTTVRSAMRGLQDAAVAADAEPGLSAGIHVHVAEPRERRDRARAFLAFLDWEDALIDLARGRFTHLRDMNRRVNTDAVSYLRTDGYIEQGRGMARAAASAIDALVARARTGDEWEGAAGLYEHHWNADRHSHLSINTRFHTWEFRIWNSTRSAWRIEMACRVALAWADTDFVDCLLHADVARTPEGFLRVIAEEWQGDDDLAALVNRQVAYLPHAGAAPARFLVA